MICELKLEISGDQGVSILRDLNVSIDQVAVDHMIDEMKKLASGIVCIKHSRYPKFLKHSQVQNGSCRLVFDVCCSENCRIFQDKAYED